MPFDPDKKVPRLNPNYSKVEGVEELSQNSVYHIANRIARCIFKVTETMNNYLVTNLTGSYPSDVKLGATVLGEDNIGGAASLMVGSNNNHSPTPSDGTVVFDVGFSYVIGDENTIGAESTPSFLFGLNNTVGSQSHHNVVFGAANSVETFVHDSIVIGTECTLFSGGNFSVALGYQTQNSSLLGISIGSYAEALTNPSAIALGNSARASGEDSIAIGKTAVAEAAGAVQIGSGINNTAFTLKYFGNVIANKLLGLVMRKSATAPPVTVDDAGALGLNAGVPQYVNAAGIWTNLGGTGTVSAIPTGVLGFQVTNSTVNLASGSPVTVKFTQSSPVATPTAGLPAITYDNTTGIFTVNQTGVFHFQITMTLQNTASTSALDASLLLVAYGGGTNNSSAQRFVSVNGINYQHFDVSGYASFEQTGNTFAFQFSSLSAANSIRLLAQGNANRASSMMQIRQVG
jgi:hypothetical protein